MYLKTLTIRGFKSFASATTFEFEPGVTAVVGPNGSGKSNVVDALAWVMGEQGAKNLRGGKMEDVIFAGTSGRSALGRAQVSLTIDNSDGALPIEYSEVTISRTLFRSGSSDYAINGTSCRLLDIQELLSDSGLGREMHVIVGQGQLDRILQATPEERRGFIEEASGILKHRRRKERSVRKLESMRQNLDRVRDLTEEVRRQLGPLSRQASTARKAQRIQFDVRDARARLLADEIVTQQSVVDSFKVDDQDIQRRLERSEQRLTEAKQQAEQQARQTAVVAQAAAAAREHRYALASLAERYRSLGAVATERLRGVSTPVPDPAGPTPHDAEEFSRQAQVEQAQASEVVTTCKQKLVEAIEAREAAERSARIAAETYTQLLQEVADRQRSLAQAQGALETAQAREQSLKAQLHQSEIESAHLTQVLQESTDHLKMVENQAQETDNSDDSLRDQLTDASNTVQAYQHQLSDLDRSISKVSGDLSAANVRHKILVDSLEPEPGSAFIELEKFDVVNVTELLQVEPGWEKAITVALGNHAVQVLLNSPQDALAAAEHLLSQSASSASLLFVPNTGESDVDVMEAVDLEPAIAASKVVEISSRLSAKQRAVIHQILAGVILVENGDQAGKVLDRLAMSGHRNMLHTVITKSGQKIDQHRVDYSHSAIPNPIEQRKQAAQAQAHTHRVQEQLDGLQRRRVCLEQDLARARERQAKAQSDINATVAQQSAMAERQSSAHRAVSQASDALRRHEARHSTLEEKLEAATTKLRQAQEHLEAVRAAAEATGQEQATPDSDEREATENIASLARHNETERRLELRTAESTLQHLQQRADQARRRVSAAQIAYREVESARQKQKSSVTRLSAIHQAVLQVTQHVDRAVHRAESDQEQLEQQRVSTEEDHDQAQQVAETARREVAGLKEELHSRQMRLQEQALKLAQLHQRSMDELAFTHEYLVEHFGPNVPVPLHPPEPLISKATPEGVGAELVETEPFNREAQARRLKRAQRELSSLGKVNPLALEEFAAVEERHTYLTEQLEDLESSRRDLLQIISDVDDTVLRVFQAAFEDTAEQFQHVFSTLFPGGWGKLSLTEPDNLLESGIEVQARPAGKKVSRLSLLSGGERSLAAIAMLVSIFKARPSPFYVMDEVEAALDDTNLSRLLTIFRELQQDSQLIIITHQKRTMEVADALYGVSMRGDGVSAVISQRLNAEEPSEELHLTD